jgi:hypothetical protein
MRWLSKKAPAAQLDLLEAKLDAASRPTLAASPTPAGAATQPPQLAQSASAHVVGLPLFIPIGLIDEDPSNPRTEFPDTEIDELADAVLQRGILQRCSSTNDRRNPDRSDRRFRHENHRNYPDFGSASLAVMNSR